MATLCGVPVITSNASSLPEVVGDAGILIDPYNPEEIAIATHKFLADQGLRKEKAEKAVKRARIFSWEKMVRETLETYKEVAESS
ncbi:MAG: glycosyltransferase [Lentisphaerae bacterium]|nr:glycosyltransferase [Lentisphaerota bacterium]